MPDGKWEPGNPANKAGTHETNPPPVHGPTPDDFDKTIKDVIPLKPAPPPPTKPPAKAPAKPPAKAPTQKPAGQPPPLITKPAAPPPPPPAVTMKPPTSKPPGKVEPPPAKPAAQTQPTKPTSQPPTMKPGSEPPKTTGVARASMDAIPPEVAEARQNPDSMLNQYVMVKQVGAGGMGAVWKAWDTKLSRWVAIKLLSVKADEYVTRFQREAKVAARLRHPNIVMVYEVNEARGQHFIAMEFVHGVGMDKAKLPMRTLIEVFVKVCRAVHSAHESGIVHRDLKPANIMITEANVPFVTDFGLAKMYSSDSALSVTGEVMGTPAYMPPEQARGEVHDIDATSDVYSLGATLYALLTQRSPFQAANATALLMKVCNEEPEAPLKVNPEVPAPVSVVVLKAMEKDKKNRYPTSAAFADDLQRWLDEQTIMAKPPGLMVRLGRKIRRNPWPLVAVVLLGLCAAVVGVVLARPPQNNNQQNANVPPVNPTDPEAQARLEAERKAIEWQNQFDTISGGIAWNNYDTRNPDREKQFGEQLRAAPDTKSGVAINWISSQLGSMSQVWAKSQWLERQGEARQFVQWCDAMTQVLASLPSTFEEVRGRVAKARDRWAPVVAYRGKLSSLKIFALPYAEVRSLSVNGQFVIRTGAIDPGASGVTILGEGLSTPLVIEGLEIGAIKLQLVDASGKAHDLEIAADALKNGANALYSGSLDDPKSFRLRSP